MPVRLNSDHLRKYVTRRGGGADRYLDKKGHQIVAIAKDLTAGPAGPASRGFPVGIRSRLLNSSLRHQVDPDAGRGLTLVLRVGTDTEYAGFVHNGTRYMMGRPFLTEAMRQCPKG